MGVDLDLSQFKHGTQLLKRGFAKMQKGGVVMDVTNAEQAAIAEELKISMPKIGKTYWVSHTSIDS